MPKVCLLLHGFTGGPYEVMPVADGLKAEGWICRVPVLPGHAEPAKALGMVRYTDWLEAVYEEADSLVKAYGSFNLVGFSMGGMLAVHVAARYPVRRLVLMNASAIYLSPRRFISEWVRRIRSQDHTARHKIRETPLRAALEFMKLVRDARPSLSKVTAQTLILQGLRDPVVHPRSARYLSKRLPGNPQVRYFPQSRHLLCLDSEADQVISAVREFLDAT